MLYNSMFREPDTLMHAEHAFWETRLDRTIEKKSWEKVHWYIHKGTMNMNTQENGYKIKTRWYRTPDLLHKFFPMVSDQGTFLHIWWDCPLIQPYWRRMHEAMTTVSLLPLEFSPAQYLLHLSKILRKRYHKSVAFYMINAARLCLPVHWRSISPPSTKEWVTRINHIAAIGADLYCPRQDPQLLQYMGSLV